MKQYISLIALAVVLVTSCKKFGDINTDPTKSSNLDPSIQLGYAQQKFSGDLNVQERLNIILTMPLVGHLGGAWANQYGQFYIKQERFSSLLWEDNYVNEIKNILDAEERTRNVSTAKNLNGMCRVMKVYLFARLTDIYGDIPYSEASSAYSKEKPLPNMISRKIFIPTFSSSWILPPPNSMKDRMW
nr:SusD/RagB family nutrient-binding outer membrane lipoprotein [Paraflavitalea speifideiaquila]